MSTTRWSHTKPNTLSVSKRKLAGLVVAGIVLYLCVAGFSGLRSSLYTVRSAHLAPVVIALLWVIASYVCAAVSYCLLAIRPVRFFPTLLIQAAGGLANRLLPGGLGGLGINALYLRRMGHTLAVSSAMVATNNFLGFIGNMVLIAAIGVLVPADYQRVDYVRGVHISALVGAVICVSIAVLLLVLLRFKLLDRARKGLADMAGYFRASAQRPWNTWFALTAQIGLTACHATAVYYVCQAYTGPVVSWPEALLAVSAGSIAGAAVPTPGGIGGAEAGIAAILIAFHVLPQTAVAIAVTYRLLTYWLPLLPGYIALRVAERRYL